MGECNKGSNSEWRRSGRTVLLFFVLMTTSTLTSAFLYEGDIWIDGVEEDTDFGSTAVQLNNAVSDRTLRWKNAVVPYKLGKAFASGERKSLIERALKDLMTRTCVRFVSRTDETHFIYFAREAPTGCYSTIARSRIGGGQLINLGVGCDTFGTVQHEVLHALGFYHEQSRTDRDEYVTIIWKNVINGRKNHNFRAERTDNLNMPYDYASIMHYAWNAFAVDHTKPTIVPKNPKTKLGNREVVSALDVEKINRLYDCHVPTATEPSTSGSNSGIEWTDNWAFGCDFPGNDLAYAKIPGELCGGKCAEYEGCTHFTWSKEDGGTCWLKQGIVTKRNAVKVHDKSVVCGVVDTAPSPPTTNAECSQQYTVQAGDIFWNIAMKYGLTLAELTSRNPHIPDPTKVFPGDVVCLGN
ncbi:hypothetical protein RvY_11417 [Ramazzottius varieornatus]|uniref:Metalloendopeptidase n=1 Tax=Ramazzottius varieornatus TaxID=947166 RepID=A0A1D1VI43_RAMVA|nr:hypothetical protein RvY_11417 [Ramazzottius varieornatus]